MPTQETATLAADTVSALQSDAQSLPDSAFQALTRPLNTATTPTTATAPPTPSESSSSSPNGTDIAPTQSSAPLWDSNNPNSRVPFIPSVDVDTPSETDGDVMADDDDLPPTPEPKVTPCHENTDTLEVCEQFDSCNVFSEPSHLTKFVQDNPDLLDSKATKGYMFIHHPHTHLVLDSAKPILSRYHRLAIDKLISISIDVDTDDAYPFFYHLTPRVPGTSPMAPIPTFPNCPNS